MGAGSVSCLGACSVLGEHSELDARPLHACDARLDQEGHTMLPTACANATPSFLFSSDATGRPILCSPVFHASRSEVVICRHRLDNGWIDDVW